jgi:hypothetical protein
MPTPTAVLIDLTDEERDRLEAWSRRPKTAQALLGCCACLILHDAARAC